MSEKLLLFAHFISINHFLFGKNLCRNLSTNNIFCSLILMLSSPIRKMKRCSKDFIMLEYGAKPFFFAFFHFAKGQSAWTEFLSEHVKRFFYRNGVNIREKRINKGNDAVLVYGGLKCFSFKIKRTKLLHFPTLSLLQNIQCSLQNLIHLQNNP